MPNFDIILIKRTITGRVNNVSIDKNSGERQFGFDDSFLVTRFLGGGGKKELIQAMFLDCLREKWRHRRFMPDSFSVRLEGSNGYFTAGFKGKGVSIVFHSNLTSPGPRAEVEILYKCTLQEGVNATDVPPNTDDNNSVSSSWLHKCCVS